jgi:hypothetical protein
VLTLAVLDDWMEIHGNYCFHLVEVFS